MSTEKTEEPTHHRLETLRRRGEVATSREVVRGCGALGVVFCLLGIGTRGAEELGSWARHLWAGEGRTQEALGVLFELGGTLALAPALVGALCAFAAGLVYTGGLFVPARMLPKWERLKLGQAWKGRLRVERLAVGGIAALAALGGVIAALAGLAHLLTETLPLLESGRRFGLETALRRASGPIVMSLAALAGIGATLVLIDAGHQRRAFRRRNRMSLREIRDEHRQLEGDPLVRAMRDEARQAWEEEGALAEVGEADLVVRNPTRIAIALRWEPEKGDTAPRVVARGRGLLAKRILRAARRHEVPCWRDRRTARVLVQSAPGETIPEETWDAVAHLYRALRTLRDPLR